MSDIQTMRTPEQQRYTKDTCPDIEKHTYCPVRKYDHAGFAAWAEKKSLRHVQMKCPTCGLFTIWKRKPKAAGEGEA